MAKKGKHTARAKRKRQTFSGRYQRKTALSYIAIIILMLALLNSYPVMEFQHLIYTSKEAELNTRAGYIASSLATLEVLVPRDVEQIMKILGNQNMSRIVVTDADGLVVFDNAVSDPMLGKYAMLPEVFRALTSNDFFASQYAEGAFESRATVPVVNRGQISGAVYLYEYDSDQALILKSLQNNLASISAIIAVVVAVLSVIVSFALSRRLRDLLRGIRLVREGEYSHRVPMRGRDELASLADEFNELTGRLQKTEATRRRFVADASHELKTPLSAIRLLTDSILQNPSIETDKIREFVADIGDESDRLSRLTGKLLALTRLDAEFFDPVRVVNVKTVVSLAIRRLAALSDHYSIELKPSMADDALIDANADGLYQIVFNLVENAIKYNKTGGQVRILLFKREGTVKLIVEDNGVGIPEEELPRVFERFYRVDKTRSREAGGAGLGLSIVRDTLSKYGGDIRLDSTMGKGTRVTVTFPVTKRKDAESEGKPLHEGKPL
ncbi:MAG: HAMP domain-containing histidine kinase [Oscillospiraceae bacterium]|nr:HAMP domain-containing histidine kinase [Oscillospiraceae bacterium]